MKAHGLLSALAAAGVAGAAYERAYRPWQLAWAATPEEAGRGHPGDGIVSNATFDATRAIAVQNSRRRQPVWSG